MLRRSFLATPLAACQLAADTPEHRIIASGDGIPHTPLEYSRLLANLAARGTLAVDHYSLGGAV